MVTPYIAVLAHILLRGKPHHSPKHRKRNPHRRSHRIAYLFRMVLRNTHQPLVWLFLALLTMLAGCDADERKFARNAYTAGDWKRSEAAWNLVLNRRPADREARMGISLALFSAAAEAEKIGLHPDWAAAEAELRILVRTDSSSQARGMLSTALQRMAAELVVDGEATAALPLLNRAIRVDSTNREAMHWKALTYRELRDTARARALWEKVVAADPHYSEAWLELGRLAWERKDAGGAWDHWTAGLQANPSDARLRYWAERAQETLEVEVLFGEGMRAP